MPAKRTRKPSESVLARRSNDQEQLLLQLKKTPVIQIACEKTGVSRASYYRWRKDDDDFAYECDGALSEGKQLVNDLAESQLLAAIRDGNMTAIIYWLKHHHKDYETRVAVTATVKQQDELTPEQEATVKQALTLGQLLPPAPDDGTEPEAD
jgi:predicted DNA binding protein